MLENKDQNRDRIGTKKETERESKKDHTRPMNIMKIV